MTTTPMDKRRLGTTQIEVTPIGLGRMPFGDEAIRTPSKPSYAPRSAAG
jgi:aryl-alcohol dehydrogenase-like predicted oxidoreductase